MIPSRRRLHADAPRCIHPVENIIRYFVIDSDSVEYVHVDQHKVEIVFLNFIKATYVHCCMRITRNFRKLHLYIFSDVVYSEKIRNLFHAIFLARALNLCEIGVS